ncbi:hypothetical protein [Tuberibacillus sp. Marseille-P3662]|uniref:hypothetical protein n=1 Tax=Tuberibacillus sp. Marseille-P3662 TaxID=1965358 RepID=UPI000A1CADE3|nr:hypothetical protein [Tuberibacillus sp. Marseille-P3662]
MNIKKRGDLIVDHYGNYYYAIDEKGETIVLVNAFMDLTFRRELDDLYFEEYQGQLVGERPMDILKGNIDIILSNQSKLKIYPMEDVEAHYNVIIEPLYTPSDSPASYRTS